MPRAAEPPVPTAPPALRLVSRRGETVIRADEIGPILRHPLPMAFYLLVLALTLAATLAHVGKSAPDAALYMRVPVLALGAALGLALTALALGALARVAAALGLARPPALRLPLLLAGGIALAQAGAILAQGLLLGLPPPAPLTTLLTWIIALALGLGFAAYARRGLAASILNDVRGTPTLPPAAPQGRSADGTLQAGGLALPTASIQSLQAQGNHVRARTDTATHILPGPLSRLVAQLPPDSGALVHRSAWVATRAVAHLHRSAKGVELVLTDGQSLRVAATRLAALQGWLSRIPAPPRAKRGRAKTTVDDPALTAPAEARRSANRAPPR